MFRNARSRGLYVKPAATCSKRSAIDGAFLIAAELESSEVNAIYARLVGPVKGTPYIMRKKIETLGSNQMHSLIRGARKFRVTAPTMARLIQDAKLACG